MVIIKKKLIISAFIITILGAGLARGSDVFAQTTKPNPLSALAQLISDKFNLNKNDVQTVIDQFQQQRKQNRQQNMNLREQNRFDQLIKDNKITKEQKQAILDEFAALKAKYNPSNNQSLTPDQKRQQFQAMQEELKSWAKSQGIDYSYIIPGFGLGGIKRGMHGFGKWTKPIPTPASG